MSLWLSCFGFFVNARLLTDDSGRAFSCVHGRESETLILADVVKRQNSANRLVCGISFLAGWTFSSKRRV